MTVDVPVVKIGGRKLPVYSVNFSGGGAVSKSVLTIKYINKDGSYDWPNLTSQSLVTIKIGTLYTFKGYAVSAEKGQDQQGRWISVKYYDDSIVLDNTFVGLAGIHGAGGETEVLSGSNYRHTILVGSEVDPCKDLEEAHVDPCAPPSSSDSTVEDNLKKIIDCAKQRLTKILDVVYSFDELLAKLAQLRIKIINRPAEKTSYFARHVGSLRDVLNAWCQEYGITYFWENGVHFVDLKKGIEINDVIDGSTCRILDKRETKSIENNFTHANINYFGLDGQIKDYVSKLNGGTRLTLLPITLSDIFKNQANGALNPFIQKYYGSIEVLQKCCVLSKYSPEFRDLYLLYRFYSVNERTNADNKKMPLLGLEIMNTLTTQGTDQGFISTYLSQFIPLLIRVSADDPQQYYAARCFYNKEVHDKFVEMEKYLANEFIGRYWIRSFNKKGYSFSAPGASVEFIPNPTAANFNFANKIPKTVLRLNSFLRSLFDVDVANGKSTDYFRGGLILAERQSPWQPEGSDIQFLTNSASLSANHFNANDDIIPPVPTPEMGGVWPEAYSFEKIDQRQPVIKIFSENFGSLNLEGISTGDHPLEKDNVNIPITLGEFSSSCGLVSSVCKAYRLTLLKNKIFIYMPVQSHDTYGNQYPGFVVTAEKDGQMDYKLLVNKIQRVFADFPKNSNDYSNSVGLKVNFRDATQYINKILDGERNSCQYDEQQVEALLRTFSSKLSFPSSVVEEKIFYSIGGAPPSNIKLQDGLSSFSMVLDSTGGLISEIEYSNLPKTQVSDSILLKDFERISNANYNKSFFSSDNKEILQ